HRRTRAQILAHRHLADDAIGRGTDERHAEHLRKRQLVVAVPGHHVHRTPPSVHPWRVPWPSRSAMLRACACRPSASANATAAGPTRCKAASSAATQVVRLRKSNTLSPEAKRAVRPVGSTWFGPAT